MLTSESNEWKLKSIEAHHTETEVNFDLKLANESPLWEQVEAYNSGDSLPLLQSLSLVNTFSTGNMHLFDAQGKIKK